MKRRGISDRHFTAVILLLAGVLWLVMTATARPADDCRTCQTVSQIGQPGPAAPAPAAPQAGACATPPMSAARPQPVRMIFRRFLGRFRLGSGC